MTSQPKILTDEEMDKWDTHIKPMRSVFMRPGHDLVDHMIKCHEAIRQLKRQVEELKAQL